MQAMAVVMGLVVAGANPVTPLGQARPDTPQIEIVGGEHAAESEFPWVVRLSNGCSGTLIESRHVLTAAHCVRRSGTDHSIVATAGSSDLYSPSAVDVPSVRVHRARGFDSVTEGDDWAVVELARPVDLPVVQLPEDSSLDDGTFTVVGWGATSENRPAQQRHLRKVQVPFVPDDTCEKLYRRNEYGFVPSDMICAGDTRNGGEDSCQGDSGGPLLRRSDNRWIQVGIVSWGLGCAREDAPGVYAQVSTFRRDIKQVVE